MPPGVNLNSDNLSESETMKNHRTLALAALLLVCFSNPASADIQDTAARSRQINTLVDRVLGEQKLKPNAPISDEQFLRRIYLAAVGRIPTGAEAIEFLKHSDPKKRDQLIDRLLESEGYVSHFYNYWADILRINRRLGRSGAANEYAYKNWVKDSLRDNKPYDQMVRELVAADGNVWENGATGYYQRDRGMPLDNMANTVRVFLGTRLECAQCHDHPFDKWTQTDFFHMASFSYGVKSGSAGGENRKMYSKGKGKRSKQDYLERMLKVGEELTGIKGFYPTSSERQIEKLFSSDNPKIVQRRSGLTEEKYRELNTKVMAVLKKSPSRDRSLSKLLSDIYDPLKYAAVNINDRDAKLPHDYQYDDAKPLAEMAPVAMFGGEITAADLKEGYLPAYANWMTAKANLRFTKLIANRLWKQVFGVGLVEPVDQITEYTKTANPALMDYLEQSMKELDYDLKSFIAMLFKSEAWQRQPHADEISPGAPFYFPGPALQRMSAEQIWDSVVTLITPDADNHHPNRASELAAIDRDREIYEALENRSPENFRTMVATLSKQSKASYAEQGVIRKKVMAARQAEDEELARDLSAQLKSVTRDMKRSISEVAYSGVVGGGSMYGAKKKRPKTPKRSSIRLEIPKGLSKQEARTWAREQKAKSAVWRRQMGGMMRASELPTPAPRGHFLREFGQSDRELIENANDAASVPQALNLMNGNMAEALAHPSSVLGQALDQCATPVEEIQTLYQLMLTRQPTVAETERLGREYKSNPEKARSNIVWAMLNTQQFIFSR
jgi:hypothetical protein